MRLPVETFTGPARGLALALLLPAVLAGCAAGGSAALDAGPLELTGPAADYPVVVGEPYRVGDRLYTPLDAFNYDETGLAAADGGQGVSASHHTLPLPSYAEVTSLESGRTILVRVERRGPMDGHALIALAPAALEQLGAAAGAPVRVRRVNPPEEDRAFLRAGRAAPLRMDTPEALLTVLRRKLAPGGGALPRPSAAPAALAKVELPPSTAAAIPPAPAPVVSPEPIRRVDTPKPPKPPETPPPATTPNGAYVVQAVALSSRERAQAVAGVIGGTVSQAGKLYRVRTGPFATRAQAQASLAKVRAAGYSQARIFTNS
ncbi:sporulation protein SsgA [Altererythrobacter soli]|uniref:Sporulation protein SsgA n=1 Tax=Croceibacterium soli TaxID=1739690 RepID=A0A6I4UV12_9SPHN|nr:SPOR domain-containing protein [Croceibacterium soli]MXP42772.1 sporulation protein SsgA [Croceibacterium soli]